MGLFKSTIFENSIILKQSLKTEYILFIKNNWDYKPFKHLFKFNIYNINLPVF